MDGGIPPIVIDNGSMSIKAGFAGDETPRVVFPTTVGKPMYWDPANMTTYVGDSALSKTGTLRLTYPMERGIVSNWDDMEVIWRHTFFKKLCVVPGIHPVLLADRPLSPFSQREKMVQIMFETFNVPAMYLANHAVLSVIANGSITGVAVDCGDGMTYSVPVFEGRALSYATLWLDFGGSDLTNYLTKMLYSRGYYLLGSEEELVLVRDMKEKLGYVALDYERELESAQRKISSDIDKNYKLPDGQVITVGAERFKCPEVLFQPYLMNKDADGIHEITNESIKKCNIDIRKMLYGNILLCGRSTLFPGFVDRMSKEITSLLAPNSLDIKVLAHPRSKHTAWYGGSVLATMASFQQKWISKSEYDESGPTIVHRQSWPLPF